jgi:hypothetical protein
VIFGRDEQGREELLAIGEVKCPDMVGTVICDAWRMSVVSPEPLSVLRNPTRVT